MERQLFGGFPQYKGERLELHFQQIQDRYSYLPKDSKSTVLAKRTPGPSLAYTLGVARRNKELLAGNHTQQTTSSRPAAKKKIRLSPKGFATDPAAQTQAKAQVYPGHSKAKEPVADQPLLQADVPSTSPGTDSEPVRKQVHVAVNPVVLLGFTVAVLSRRVHSG
ncbi:hypothetical protein NQ315_009049 [Exocentrus adspersus]|uniref:Uncharacterized protein n=1 Tax=Exocentrus adspersus TaxID=1586481 RepID=A0AAV8VDG7_9CUCU|nr:hypothetical protein NQ315_009049 [Exocentrus adspersus]